MRRLALYACLAIAQAGAAMAAGEGQPLKPSEITEAALAEALAPQPALPEASASGPRSRGFKPSVQKPKASAAMLITFVTNSAELTAESKSALDVVARALRGGRLLDRSFVVEGHADPRGDAELNLELSRARAQSVVNYLVMEHGIDRQRLEPLGKGSTEPLNKAQPDVPENRRVTFVTR
jgi:OmpA-OmpF porin, OOP family